MQIEKLKLVQFRNHSFKELKFNDKFNVFFGKNGVGKTNLLESIVYLSLGKSTFIPKDQDNIMEGKTYFRIESTFLSPSKKYQIIYAFEKKKKRILQVNEVVVQKIMDHVGRFPVVMVHPHDIDLIREGSEIRRKLIDSFLCQMDKSYLYDLLTYNKALKNRNVLLKKFAHIGTPHWDETRPFEHIMAEKSKFIFEKRKQWIKDINPFFSTINTLVAGKDEQVTTTYISQLEENDLATWFDLTREKDSYTQRTNAGIHKDDLVFSIRNVPLKRFASQGQQKTLLIALKVAMIELSKQKYEKNPILLLDDLFGKLDESRIKNLLNYLSKMHQTQIFIADALKDRTTHLFSAINQNYSAFDL